MRRLVRGSVFRVGQKVRVEGDSTGDYVGVVSATHVRVTKPDSAYEEKLVTKPGVTVKVKEWEGLDVEGDKMEVLAWDDETRRV